MQFNENRFPSPVSIGGRKYILNVPFRISCGAFLPYSFEAPREYLDLTDFQQNLDRFVAGIRTPRPNSIAGRTTGDSMTGTAIRHGDTVIIEVLESEQIIYGRTALIENAGDEEESGAWALKKLVLVRDRTIALNSFGEIHNWDDQIIELRSSNPQFRPATLDKSGRYRVRGYLLRILRPEEVKPIPADDLMWRLNNDELPE
jgi:hypothetical protein